AAKAPPSPPVTKGPAPAASAPVTPVLPSVAPAPTPAQLPTTLSLPPVNNNNRVERAVNATIADGTPIRILLAADIPADPQEGLALRFTVADGVRVEDSVLVAKGAVVTGEVVEASKRKFIGSSKATYRLIQVDAVDGRKLNLRATPARSSEGPARRPV